MTTTSVSISGTISKNGGPQSGVNVALSGTSSASTTTNASGQYSFSNLTTGGNYLVTPTLAGNSFEPTSRSYTNLMANVTNADFTGFDTNSLPRKLSVTNTPAVPGQSATVPIMLASQGNEAGLTFSLSYDPSLLLNPTVACGSDAGAGCSLAVNSTTPGQIGISVDPVSTFVAGSRQVVTVTFTTTSTTAPNTPINFSDTPAVREVSDSNANALPTAYTNGFVVFSQGIESDVAPRPNGNGSVSSTDVTQVRRFSVGLDTPDSSTNEFQRADSAPIGTSGNGQIAATDVTQARRYQLGSDPSQPAGGPTQPGPVAPQGGGRSSRPKAAKARAEAETVTRVVRVINVDASAGQQVTVTLQADAQGDENVYGFSLNYDPAKLSNPVVTTGADATGGDVMVNTAPSGKIGFSLDFGGATMPAGNTKQLITVRFDVAANAPLGLTPLTFGDTPAQREVSNPQAQAVPTTFTDGNVNITAPVSSVSVSGHVVTTDGRPIRNVVVSLTDSTGAIRTVLSDSLGNYQFSNVLTGQTYLLRGTSKRYRFASRDVTVSGNVSGLDLTGEE